MLFSSQKGNETAKIRDEKASFDMEKKDFCKKLKKKEFVMATSVVVVFLNFNFFFKNLLTYRRYSKVKLISKSVKFRKQRMVDLC